MRAYELMTDNPELSHDDQSFRLIEAVCKRYKTHRNMGEIDRDFIIVIMVLSTICHALGPPKQKCEKSRLFSRKLVEKYNFWLNNNFC